ncbi:MAG: endonuclease [Desulfurococcaceae archaeon]
MTKIHFDSESCKGYLNRSPRADELAERWFGVYHNDRLVLNLVEVAYLLSTSKALVRLDDGSEVREVEELIKKRGSCFDKYFWPMLAVFKDLRERGRRTRVLDQCKFLVKDKTGDLRLIYVLEEKLNIDMQTLHNIVDEARRNNLKVTLAIVSLQGELTYYDIVPADIRVDRVD